MPKTRALLAAFVLAATPVIATAACYGDGHDQATMSCAAGSVWDAESQRCVPTTG